MLGSQTIPFRNWRRKDMRHSIHLIDSGEGFLYVNRHMPSVRSLREIARKSHVSVMTVSRTLRGHLNVAAQTRERILKVAEELHYRPNPMVITLMRSRGARSSAPASAVLGFITAFDTRDGWRLSALNVEFY